MVAPGPPAAPGDDERRAALLDGLPDDAVHLTPRALLWGAAGELAAPEPHGHGACLVARDEPLVFVLGEPGGRCLRRALATYGRDGECLCLPGSSAHVQEGLPNWSPRRALIHEAGRPPTALPASRDLTLHGPGLATLPDLDHLEPELAARVDEMVRRGPLAAAWWGHRPVSFCMAPFVTRGRWDVEVETGAAWRGRRLAERAFRLLVGVQRDLGREPVWGALEDNQASLALARRLDFRPVGALDVFTRTGP